eukprot:Amastigsp_a677140_25.p3 type:complete len:134 gc:universal Amastigsp_a677140_25:730-329(-)
MRMQPAARKSASSMQPLASSATPLSPMSVQSLRSTNLRCAKYAPRYVQPRSVRCWHELSVNRSSRAAPPPSPSCLSPRSVIERHTAMLRSRSCGGVSLSPSRVPSHCSERSDVSDDDGSTATVRVTLSSSTGM